MTRYLLLFLLMLAGISYGYAQDGTASYKTQEEGQRERTIDSIKFELMHIHKVRDANADSALSILYHLYDRAVRIGYLEGIGATSGEIGATFMNKGDFNKAEKYILYAQLLPQLSEYFSANAINNLYLVYESRGDYNLALRYLKKAMGAKDENIAHSAYNNYIALLMKLGRYKESVYYIGILKEKARALKQGRILAALLCNEAPIYGSQKDYRTFDALTSECLKLCLDSGFTDIASYCRINAAISYYERGEQERAIREFMTVKEVVPRLNPDYQMNFYTEYGKVLYQNGAYREAVQALDRALRLADRIGISTHIDPVYFLAKSYQELGDYRKANQKLEQYIRLKDSFENMDIQKNISEYEVRFRTAEKDNELLQKKLVILKQSGRINSKNTLIVLTVAGLAILLVLFIAYYKYARQNLLMLERDLDLAEQKSKVNFLKAMIQGEEKERKRIGVELHNGIGSQLTAINLNLTAFQWKNKHIEEIGSLDEVVNQIQQTAIDVRRTAHNLAPSGILEAGLHQALLEFTRQFKNGPVAIEVAHTGDMTQVSGGLALLVYRILQELIHNAIKHADATRIDIELKLSGDTLSASVKDNGKGFNPDDRTGRGLGLQQIQEQLRLLKGTFRIHSRPQAGTAISLEVNLKYSKDDQPL
jgi:signal transduction histidine kinase/Flp pilus assembly protein TadD